MRDQSNIRLITPIVTAFKQHYGNKPNIDSIDFKAYKTIIPYTAYWSDGLLFFGTTGEFQFLNLETRELFIKRISEMFQNLDKATELIFNITPSLYEELDEITIKNFSDVVKKSFPKASLLYQPGFNTQSIETAMRNLKHVLAIAEYYDMGVYLYENPYNSYKELNSYKTHKINTKKDNNPKRYNESRRDSNNRKNLSLDELIDDPRFSKFIMNERVLGLKDSRILDTSILDFPEASESIRKIQTFLLDNKKQYLIGNDNLLEHARFLEASGIIASIANAYPFIAFDTLNYFRVDSVEQSLIKTRASGSLYLLVDSIRHHPDGYIAGLKLLMSNLIIRDTLKGDIQDIYHIKLLEPVFIHPKNQVLMPIENYNPITKRAEQLSWFINAYRTNNGLTILSLKPSYELKLSTSDSSGKPKSQNSKIHTHNQESKNQLRVVASGVF